MNKRGQSTLEYAVIIAVVAAGLIAIQMYLQRSVQGKLRESTDRIGEQYSAGNMTSKYTTQQTGNLVTQETFGKEGKGISKYTVNAPANVTRSAQGDNAEKINSNLSDESLF